MSLPINSVPPSPLPPAASAPWPIQPPPHGAAFVIPVRPLARSRAQSSRAGAFLAAAAAAAGLAVAIPLLIARRARSASPNRSGRGAKV